MCCFQGAMQTPKLGEAALNLFLLMPALPDSKSLERDFSKGHSQARIGWVLAKFKKDPIQLALAPNIGLIV